MQFTLLAPSALVREKLRDLISRSFLGSILLQTDYSRNPTHLQYFEHGSSTCTLAEVWHPLQSFLVLLFMLLVVLLLLNLCSLPHPLYLPAVPAAIHIIHFKMTLNPQAEYTARHHKSVASSSSFNPSHIHQYPSRLRISCKESPTSCQSDRLRA